MSGRTFEFEMSLYDDFDREILVLVQMSSGCAGRYSGPYEESYPARGPEILETEAVWADTKIQLTDEEYEKIIIPQEEEIFYYGARYEKDTRYD